LHFGHRSVAVFMSHMSRDICLCYQWPLYGVGSSTRHECDMTKPYGCDINGYPLDPDHPWNWPAEEQEREHQRAFARRLDLLGHDWREGDLLAAAEAARLCRLYRQPPPPWLVDAIAALVDQHMTDAEKRGRRALAIHLARWEAVKELRERRQQLLEEHGDDRGTSWERVWPAVSDILNNTAAAGSEETVRASYKLIQDAGGERAMLESYRLALRQRQGKAHTKAP
jgi:hypothetical protein